MGFVLYGASPAKISDVNINRTWKYKQQISTALEIPGPDLEHPHFNYDDRLFVFDKNKLRTGKTTHFRHLSLRTFTDILHSPQFNFLSLHSLGT